MLSSPGLGDFAQRRLDFSDPRLTDRRSGHSCRPTNVRRRGNLRRMVSDADRTKMRRLARDLASGESDNRGTPEQRRRMLGTINADRRRQGLEPLIDRAPEEGLYERARSLGMARVDR